MQINKKLKDTCNKIERTPDEPLFDLNLRSFLFE